MKKINWPSEKESDLLDVIAFRYHNKKPLPFPFICYYNYKSTKGGGL